MAGTIQGAINSMIGSATAAVGAVSHISGQLKKQNEAKLKGLQEGSTPQEQAAQRAKQSADGEIQAKGKQKRDFMEYLKKVPTSLGGNVGQLPEHLQKTIASQYTKADRKKLMDDMDREAKK